jgi:hypothetical protein
VRLNKSKFLAWLRRKRPDEIVGVHRTACGCPITNFYVEASGGHEVSIFDRWGDYFMDRGYDKRQLPEWAQRFVSEVDMNDDRRITADRAIQILLADT